MNDKQLKQISEHLELVLEKKVNGKIDKLHEEFIEIIEKQNEKMQPVYDAYNVAKKGGNFIVWISKIIIAIGVIVGVIISIIKFK